MRHAALVFILALMASPAFAVAQWPDDTFPLPPLKYEGVPEHRVVVNYLPAKALRAKCKEGGLNAFACTKNGVQTNGSPVSIIWVRDDLCAGGRHDCKLEDWVMRHEHGHANGWEGHKGARHVAY